MNHPDLILSVNKITKIFGEQKALDDVSFSLSKGEFFSLLGPSGCGKTTLLRIIAGLEFPTAGSVELNGKNATSLPPQKRNIGVVFQNYALFPNMTVFQNVAYGLEVRKLPADKIKEKVGTVLEKVRISHKSDSNVAFLSGGEQQRVSLARVIVTEPDLLLFDEPLSNLDYTLRLESRIEIKRLQRDVGITSVYVTHDQSEALALSDRIAVMNHGRIIQTGTPVEVYMNPSTVFVSEFIGHSNFFTAEEAVKYFGIRIESDEVLSVFPEELEITDSEAGDFLVADVQFGGASIEYKLMKDTKFISVVSQYWSGQRIFRTGESVSIRPLNYNARILRK